MAWKQSHVWKDVGGDNERHARVEMGWEGKRATLKKGCAWKEKGWSTRAIAHEEYRGNSKCNTPDLLVPRSVVGINIDVSVEAGGTHATNEKDCGVQDASLDNLTYPWEKNCKRWPFSIAWTPIHHVPFRVTRH